MARRPRQRKTATKKKSLNKVVKTILQKQSDQKHLYVDNGLSAVNFTKAGILYNLSRIAQGVSDNQRTADQVRLSRMNIRLRIVNSSAVNAVACRVIIYRYKPIDTATTPQVGYPIEYPVNTDYQTALSPITAKYKSDFVILKDYQFMLSNTYDTSFKNLNWNINLRDSEQLYTSTYSTNQIYMELYTQGVTTASIVFVSKLSYYNI